LGWVASELSRRQDAKAIDSPVPVRTAAVDPTEPAGTPRVTPFLAGEALRKQPSWRPTRNLIALASDESGNDDIWICDPSGANPLNLTASFKGADSHPAWSPDGQRLVYFSERDGGGLFTMTLLGGDIRKLIPLQPGRVPSLTIGW